MSLTEKTTQPRSPLPQSHLRNTDHCSAEMFLSMGLLLGALLSKEWQ